MKHARRLVSGLGTLLALGLPVVALVMLGVPTLGLYAVVASVLALAYALGMLWEVVS